MTGPAKEPHLLQIQKSSKQTTEGGTSLDGVGGSEGDMDTHLFNKR